jgi:predicted nucleotidyltransferase
MKRDIPDVVLKDIITFSERNSVNKVILFGSRASGTNTERSDIDLAVYGGDFDSFYWNIKDNVNSLLSFDIINADKNISEKLKLEIERNGIVIYEKV